MRVAECIECWVSSHREKLEDAARGPTNDDSSCATRLQAELEKLREDESSEGGTIRCGAEHIVIPYTIASDVSEAQESLYQFFVVPAAAKRKISTLF